jgi:hypothetical protein
METTQEILMAFMQHHAAGMEELLDYEDGHKPERGLLLGVVGPDAGEVGWSARVRFADGMRRWVSLAVVRFLPPPSGQEAGVE